MPDEALHVVEADSIRMAIALGKAHGVVAPMVRLATDEEIEGVMARSGHRTRRAARVDRYRARVVGRS
jgi:fructose/tagatose bisphosphate aldolase